LGVTEWPELSFGTKVTLSQNRKSLAIFDEKNFAHFFTFLCVRNVLVLKRVCDPLLRTAQFFFCFCARLFHLPEFYAGGRMPWRFGTPEPKKKGQ
jgi:hypothetical protein